jgi:uncharacterized protein
MLTTLELLVLAAIFLLTSVVGVVTGSNSLITVPAMFSFGIEPRTAIATNMLALTFMSVGGSVPFIGKSRIDRSRLPALIALTVAGSIIGAMLVFIIPAAALPLIISLSMIAVAVFSIAKQDAGIVPAEGKPSRMAEAAGYAATFALGIYGGFFSGGYVTLLTAAYVALFRLTFVEAVGVTKIINVFSSAVATIIFMWRGLVDYRLGLLLGGVMFVGAIIGAKLAIKMSNLWLRRIFLAAVIMLALKTLLFDFGYEMLK